MANDKKIEQAIATDAGKALAWKQGEGKQLREGEKPSAPPNLVLPRPVKVPLAPASAKSDKK